VLAPCATSCGGDEPPSGRRPDAGRVLADAGGVPTDGASAGTDAGGSSDDAGGVSTDAGSSGTDAGTTLGPCDPIPGASYRTLTISGAPTDRPPPVHGDLNLELRGWEPTGGVLALVDLTGPTDLLAPKLNHLFTDNREPAFVQNYRAHDWDWGCNCRGAVITDWDVTVSGMRTSPDEVLEVPTSGYDIGEGLRALVLFVDDDSLTLKFTREDNVVSGYTVHVQGVCVEPSLRALYDARRAAGSSELPALAGDQPFGRARTSEILVAIRDTGAFMDPRSRKDWW